MSVATASELAPTRGRPWGLWRRQIRAILSLEVRKSFWGRRAVVVYLLALAPMALMVLAAVAAVIEAELQGRAEPLADDVFAGIYQVFILRWCIFFGCVAIFMNLFRGEILDGSLHYYFLAPIRRDVLVVGKYLAGLLAAVVLFCWATAVSWLLSLVPLLLEAPLSQVLTSARLEQLVAYIFITALACMGYGALFLVIGLLFKNPVLPALVILAWESIIFLLPPVLQQLSVVHYLESLMPIPMSEGPFAIVVEPAPAWLSVLGLTLFAAMLLVVAAWRVRRLEISYEAS